MKHLSINRRLNWISKPVSPKFKVKNDIKNDSNEQLINKMCQKILDRENPDFRFLMQPSKNSSEIQRLNEEDKESKNK